MEQKVSNKILLWAVVISCAISVIVMVFLASLSHRLTLLEDQHKTIVATSSSVVALGPVLFQGFAGKSISTTISSSDGKKIIELRGHIMKNPKVGYESVPDKDTLTKKILIDANTKIYTIVKGMKYPRVSEITFDQLVSASTAGVYIAAYEAEGEELITDATAAHSVSFFSE